MEHISNYQEVLSEIFRILRKGGQLIFSVDSLENIENDSIIQYHAKKYEIEKYFKPLELKRILESIGFLNIKIHPICRSDYAKKLFLKELFNKAKFQYFFSLIEYLLLYYNETRKKKRSNGLYLIVNCFK